MELYNREFVYFDWDDELEGKKGFFSNNINDLKRSVKDNRTMWYGEICKNVNTNTDYPFGFIDDFGISHCFRFCYYDPYYEFRKACLEGKRLQFKNNNGNWEDVRGEPIFENDEYRIKPVKTKWYIVLDEYGLSRTNSKEGERCVLFEGTEDECIKWMDEHKKFEKIMLAWINGAQIELEIQDPIRGIICVPATKPTWNISNNYRVKPEPEYIPFDSVEGLINAWDEKYPQNKNRPKGTMPLIWIENKAYKGTVSLITDYYFERSMHDADVGTNEGDYTLKELFEDYTFLDDSIIGKEKE